VLFDLPVNNNFTNSFPDKRKIKPEDAEKITSNNTPKFSYPLPLHQKIILYT